MMAAQFQGSRTAMRAAAVAVVWLVLISVLHARLNGEQHSSEKVVMGYMPVITNLAAPLLDAASRDRDLRFEAIKFASFAEMSEAFKAGHIQVAFIIAPLAFVMHHQGVPLRVVYIGNRHESTLVGRQDLPSGDLKQLAGKTIAVPIRYSGHLLAVRRTLRQQGLPDDAIRLVEIPPPDMPAALATGGVDGYFVGEPFATKALRDGSAKRLINVEQIWPKFICNLMIVRNELIESKPEVVSRLVSGAVRSGLWARENLDEANQVVSRYWGQDPSFVRHVFDEPPGRFRFDLYHPEIGEMEEMALEMRLAGLISGPLDVRGLIEDRFAKAASTQSVRALKDIWEK